MSLTRNIKGLNNHLFSQLEKLINEDLTGEELKEEIERSKAVSLITKDILGAAHLAINAERLRHDLGANIGNVPLLGDSNG